VLAAQEQALPADAEHAPRLDRLEDHPDRDYFVAVLGVGFAARRYSKTKLD
jgi:hypothetical protein